MDHQKALDRIRVTRNLFSKILDNLTLEQVNHQPKEFKNSIGWNYAHVIATQQLLIYGLHKMPFTLPQDFIDTYRKGTQTEKPISKEEWDTILTYANESIDQLEKDVNAKIFGEFQTYPTSYGVTLNSLEDALSFIPVHEALHLGMCMARKKPLL